MNIYQLFRYPSKYWCRVKLLNILPQNIINVQKIEKFKSFNKKKKLLEICPWSLKE